MQTWTRNNIELIGWQFIPERMAELGLTAADGQTQAWFVDAHGRLSGGAEAINLALRSCWWLHPFTYLYYVPGLRWLENRAYRWIADNRQSLPGSTDACAMPPAKPHQK